MSDLLEAARLTSLLWGGLFNPFLPLRDAETLDREVAAFWIDAMHPVAAGDASVADVLSRHPELRWPLFGEGLIVRGEGAPYLRPLDLSGALAAFVQRVREERPRVPAVLPVWDQSDRYALVYALTFGDFTRASELLGEDLTASFVRATGALEVPASAALSERTLGMRHLSAFGLQWQLAWDARDRDVSVFLGNPRSAHDLAAYWNTRACGLPTVFWDRTQAEQPFRRALESTLQRIREDERARSADAPPHIRPMWVECYSTTPQNRLRVPSELQDLFGEDFLAVPRSLASAPGRAPWRDLAFLDPPATDAQLVLANVEERDQRSRLQLQLPALPVAARPRRRQTYGITVDASFESGYAGTLRFPPLPDLNEWLRFEVTVTDPVRVGRESFTVLDDVPTGTLALESVPKEAILARLFERAGITTTRSLPGEVAWHLLSQLGGLEVCSMLRLPGVRRLLASTAARTGIRRKAAEDLINDQGSFAAGPPMYSGGRRLGPRDLLAFLATRRIFLPGLALECARCRHTRFYPAKELDDEIRCPRCGHTFPLGPALVGDPIRLRLSGLFEEPGDRALREGQPAAIAVLLTLLYISEWHMGIDGYVFDVSYDLHGPRIPTCETDLVAISYGTRPDLHTHILIGECKGQGRIEQDDITKLARVADAIRSSGLACDLIFSTTRAAFSEEELDLFRRHYESSHPHEMLRRAPILLTQADLESEALTADDDRHQYTFHGFDGLAELSKRRYFDL
jgi:hypothetical protein